MATTLDAPKGGIIVDHYVDYYLNKYGLVLDLLNISCMCYLSAALGISPWCFCNRIGVSEVNVSCEMDCS